ncbi:HlyD family type I secretion periplasmic adaptor subunit [Sphingomonas sp. CFBP 13714]|jgi:adhesin transport system membrane fusion protein|uniref:HlyD family type I secretion periplasmic adaptor subunit n=1 Tax=Sphingomonas sp. CFBP 13714 TaxID=2775308 RepID=UPI00177FEA37|nr:HlyD family type I secretion periplasmic adaptor subunit [Sphingomonas sp. CFBP 13714]MBD8700808.1 HlyD family type I secretion periplasmic adaptor subunit [Sphingomonas sp. CFBP 13714]
MSARAIDDDHLFGGEGSVRLATATRLVWILAALFVAALGWAWFAALDEVATGEARVVPTSREQVIQSLEGGILTKLPVRQDDIVTPGQLLAQLDPTQAGSTVDETAAKYRAALASVARLQAEANGTPLTFAAELDRYPELKAAETRLHDTRRRSLQSSIQLIDQSLALIGREVRIGESLIAVGAASNVEVLRLQRQRAELELKKADLRSQYMVEARQDLAKVTEQVDSLAPVVRGRSDTLSRLTLRSPVRGVVKNIEVSTIGGVVPPNGKLMEIVPLDDRLLIEARIQPRDIAFIRPGQAASVKVTAYDYSIYGGLTGSVVSISPDTIRDEVKPDILYYRVFVRTKADSLTNKAGARFAITPGMVATVDIHTGSKTVLQYLVKPLNRAREALRER